MKVRRDVTTAEDQERGEGAAVMCNGRLFHRQAAASGNRIED